MTKHLKLIIKLSFILKYYKINNNKDITHDLHYVLRVRPHSTQTKFWEILTPPSLGVDSLFTVAYFLD